MPGPAAPGLRDLALDARQHVLDLELSAAGCVSLRIGHSGASCIREHAPEEVQASCGDLGWVEVLLPSERTHNGDCIRLPFRGGSAADDATPKGHPRPVAHATPFATPLRVTTSVGWRRPVSLRCCRSSLTPVVTYGSRDLQNHHSPVQIRAAPRPETPRPSSGAGFCFCSATEVMLALLHSFTCIAI
jgi:hypothetical protein